MHHRRQPLSVVALAIGIAMPSMSSAQPSPEQQTPARETPARETIDERMLELEAQVRTLSERVELLEQRAVTAGPRASAAAGTGSGSRSGLASSTSGAGIVWSLDPGVAGSPLRVTHKEFDRNSGRVDLLVEITAPVQDPQRWDEVGGDVPVMLRLRSADGAEHVQAFTLARGKRIEPGAFVHLIADIDPARAATAAQFIIAPTDN
jgi:hypothetical protein